MIFAKSKAEEVKNFFNYQKEVFGDSLILDLDLVSLENELIKKNNLEIRDSIEVPKKTEKKVEIKNTVEPTLPKFQPKEDSIASDWLLSSDLDVLNQKINNCLRCPLGETRNKFVFGYGNPNADILIIGEAPGADEDESGLPFIGSAGQLLTKILAAINLSREEVYIANIIKCRPPNNRRPNAQEVEKCEPYLHKQIELINPKFILALGLTAIDSLFKTKNTMGEVRGQILNYQNRKVICTYHPSALNRNPEWKKFAWEDVKLLRKLYDESKDN